VPPHTRYSVRTNIRQNKKKFFLLSSSSLLFIPTDPSIHYNHNHKSKNTKHKTTTTIKKTKKMTKTLSLIIVLFGLSCIVGAKKAQRSCTKGAGAGAGTGAGTGTGSQQAFCDITFTQPIPPEVCEDIIHEDGLIEHACFSEGPHFITVTLDQRTPAHSESSAIDHAVEFYGTCNKCTLELWADEGCQGAASESYEFNPEQPGLSVQESECFRVSCEF
jgi:hypothetical protein